ncbi:MAG: hypothetical protein CL678_07535 [Bdellovibrionaceae bacterium]|nr:hypothetical protein [Pseudobdellovibrionaceae bacterium]
MRVHNISAAAGVPKTMWRGGLGEVRSGLHGPVRLARVPPSLMQAALIAASIWNRYVPDLPPRYFNISEMDLPGSIVGQIWIPCPNSVCNVTIDPSYAAPINVLVHEMGHGIGLPEGSVSGLGSVVDDSNHWFPESIDPTEIMTETISTQPYLSTYTLRAMAGTGHRGCVDDYQCPNDLVCYPTSIYNSPGTCAAPGFPLVDHTHALDPTWPLLVLTIPLIGIVAVTLAMF